MKHIYWVGKYRSPSFFLNKIMMFIFLNNMGLASWVRGQGSEVREGQGLFCFDTIHCCEYTYIVLYNINMNECINFVLNIIRMNIRFFTLDKKIKIEGLLFWGYFTVRGANG